MTVATFAIGLPGHPPRFFLTAPGDEILANLRDGEVSVTQTVFPPAPHIIAADGLSVIAIEADPTHAIEAAWTAIRMERNALLDFSRWTIAPDSPLSVPNQAEWLAYLKALNRLTIDFEAPGDVVWPDAPLMVYVAE
jgi:hypothetical protein